MGVDLGDPAAVEDDLRATVAALTERLRTDHRGRRREPARRPAGRTATGRRRSRRSPRPRRSTALDADSVLVEPRAPAPPGHHRRRRGRRAAHRPDAAAARERRPRRCGRCSTASGCGSPTCPASTCRTRWCWPDGWSASRSSWSTLAVTVSDRRSSRRRACAVAAAAARRPDGRVRPRRPPASCWSSSPAAGGGRRSPRPGWTRRSGARCPPAPSRWGCGCC